MSTKASFESHDLFELGNEDTELVSGGLVNFAAGAAVGAGTYLIYAGMTGNFSWGGLAGSTVAGAVTSGFSALAGGGVGATAYFAGVGAAAGAATDNAVSVGTK